MDLDNVSVRSSLLLAGIVVALSALIGFALPSLSSGQPAGPKVASGAWSPPAPTEAATASPEPLPATPPAAPINRDQDDESPSAGTRRAPVVLEAPAPATQLLIRLAAQPETPSTPLAVDAPRREERMAIAASDPKLAPRGSVTVAVPIPVARGPNDAPRPARTAAALPRLASTPAPTTTASAPTTSAAAQQIAPAAALDGRSVQATAAPASLPQRTVPTAAVRSTPTPPPADTRPGAPQLINPPADARLSGLVTFEWRPVSELPRGAAYEIVVWSPEQDPNQARGIMPAALVTSQEVNLDRLFESGRFRTGNLYWTVLVVQREPYLRLTAPGDGEARYLAHRSGG